jgi:hypothetical protein
MTPDRAISRRPKQLSRTPGDLDWITSLHPDAPSSNFKQIMAAGTSIIGKPWFTRAWVIQEVVNPGPVHFRLGKMEISFQRLFDLVHSFRVWFRLWTTLTLTGENDLDRLSAILWKEWAFSICNDNWDDNSFPDGGKTLQNMWHLKSMEVRFPGRIVSNYHPQLEALRSISSETLKSFYWANLGQPKGPLACKSQAEREDLLSHLKSYLRTWKFDEKRQSQAENNQTTQEAISNLNPDELASILIDFHNSLVSSLPNKPFEDSLPNRVAEPTQSLSIPRGRHRIAGPIKRILSSFRKQLPNKVAEPTQSLSIPRGRLCIAWPLEILLSRFRSQKATDPRDKIYSLLGIAGPIHNICIDYSQTADQLYLQVATSILYTEMWNKGTYLLLFVECADPPGFSPNRPSWVPCWSGKETRNGKACWEKWYRFNASADIRFDAVADSQEISEVIEERDLRDKGN